MKAITALALLCFVGVSACSTTGPSAPGAAASCACGKKASDCGCEKCKGGDAAGCECGKKVTAHTGHSHTGGNGEFSACGH
jgi:hypothetical protein